MGRDTIAVAFSLLRASQSKWEWVWGVVLKGGYFMSKSVGRVSIKRVYAEAASTDGIRILVDRLWPRGLTKEKAKVDIWLKDVAPSNDLRKWFAHDPAKWAEFRARYMDELKSSGEPLALLRQKAAEGHVTLLFGARDEQHNEAVILKQLLDRH